MSYAGDENAPGFPSNDVQLVLEGVDVALQFVKRHAVGRYMQDAVMIRHGTRERDKDVLLRDWDGFARALVSWWRSTRA